MNLSQEYEVSFLPNLDSFRRIERTHWNYNKELIHLWNKFRLEGELKYRHSFICSTCNFHQKCDGYFFLPDYDYNTERQKYHCNCICHIKPRGISHVNFSDIVERKGALI